MGIARMRHPVTGDMYWDENGNVRVESADGRVGRFSNRGKWLSGEIRGADPMMCIWIAGHNFGDEVPFRNQRLQARHGAGWQPTAKKDPAT